MSDITFEELNNRLPTSKRLPLAQSAPDAVLAPDHQDFFVAPVLKKVWQEEARSSVVIVSARGAVGKTTFANELAWKAGAHLWPLGRFQVGHQFLEGALATAYGDEAYSEAARELREGKRLVVLDGLDEARLHAGERNFDAFLDSIARRFRDAGERPSLVILGRPLAAGYTANRLFDFGVSFEWYEIDYFGEDAAEQFVENYLDHGDHKPHQQYRGDFERARRALFDWLAESIPEGVEVKSLIGYAPVLLFIAELLDVGNPYAQVQQLRKAVQQGRPGTPLVKIAEGLLMRDMGKVVDELPNEQLRKEYRDADVWSPDEQCIRFLARKVNYELKARPPVELPDRLRSDYEESVQGWIGDHPFNDQPLFEDYVIAWLLAGGIVEEDLAEAVRDYLKSEQAGYRPTPLLLWFVSHANGEDSARENVVIDAADFGFLYESALADAASAAPSGSRPPEAKFPKLGLTSFDGGEPLVGEIRFPTPSEASDETGGRKVSLNLRNTGRALWFWRNLRTADIGVAGTVRIGGGAGDFLLGPDVDLECEEFACDAKVLRVVAPSESEGVVLLAERYGSDAVPELSSWGNGSLHLRVRWEPLHYPWNGYPLPASRDTRVTEEIKQAFLKLRRILMLFRAKGYESLARTGELVENPVFAGSGLARELMYYCQEKKLIRKVGGFYWLSRQELDDRGLSWEDLRGHRISPPTASFLSDFLASRRG